MSDYREYLDARFEGGPLDKQVRPVPGYDTYAHKVDGDLAVYRRRQLVVCAADGVLVGFVFAHAFTEQGRG